jgi:hypothetical protein
MASGDICNICKLNFYEFSFEEDANPSWSQSKKNILLLIDSF